MKKQKKLPEPQLFPVGGRMGKVSIHRNGKEHVLVVSYANGEMIPAEVQDIYGPVIREVVIDFMLKVAGKRKS